ncbi:hypothetical protein Scep_008222 [Stephania cephalantha]|uniref:Uncharacterized protein n=1 Tax=Stephania cephalantha TaxID=152367 RepID=A0AAP0KCJ6_9MAGN
MMEGSKALVAPPSSPSQTLSPPLAESESQMSNLVYDVWEEFEFLEVSQHFQAAMENMLKMINDVDQSSIEIMEEMEKCKDSVSLKRQILAEEKERFQKAAYTIIDMLNS